MRKTLISVLSLLALIAGLFSGPIPAASAADASNDATLKSLSFGSDNSFVRWGWRYDTSGLMPAFEPSRVKYQLVTVADQLNLLAETNDAAATFKVTFAGTTSNATSGVNFPMNLAPAVQDVVITVTAPDLVTKKSYRVTISNQVLVKPELLSVSTEHSNFRGNQTLVARIKNAIFTDSGVAGGTGVGCGVTMYASAIDPSTGTEIANGFNPSFSGSTRPLPDENGVSSVKFFVYGAPLNNKVVDYKLWLQSSCGLSQGDNMWKTMSSASASAITFKYDQDLKVSSANHSATLTSGSEITLNGSNISTYSPFNVYLLDVKTGERVGVPAIPVSDESTGLATEHWTGYVDTSYRPASFSTPGKKQLIVETWVPDSEDPLVLFSKEISWKPIAPSRVLLKPAKGPLAGGNVILISGANLCNFGVDPQTAGVKIDGKPATKVELTDGYCANGYNYLTHTFDTQRLSVTIPAGSSVGAKSIEIDNGSGFVKVPVSYTYGALPEVTSVNPQSVASTGGSTVTILGKNFGSSGTPVVTVGGQKAQLVSRVSDGELRVMLPSKLNLGSQSITIISSSGGGSATDVATITVVARGTNPTITSLSKTSTLASGGEQITIIGRNFGAAGTVGVSVGDYPAVVVSNSSTSIVIEVPAHLVGSKSVRVFSVTGVTTKLGAITYLAVPAVTSVSPAVIASSADAANRTVLVTGVGFGATGTIQIGTGAPASYSATDAGTKISVVIPNDTIGSLPILITPAGATEPLVGSVRVASPTLSYVGDESLSPVYQIHCRPDDFDCIWNRSHPAFSAAGAGKLVVKGTGFGISGKVLVNGKELPTTTYSDTEIRVTLPKLASGYYSLRVAPTVGIATDLYTKAFSVNSNAPLSKLRVTKVYSQVANTRGAPSYTFDPSIDTSSTFVIEGSGFLGSDAGASTKVYQTDQYDPINNPNLVSVAVTSITDTKIVFRVSRSFNPVVWVGVFIKTNQERSLTSAAIHYVGAQPTSATINGSVGLCTKDSRGAFSPAVVTVTGTGLFGATGTVTLDGQSIDAAAINWTADSVTVDFSRLPADLAEHWGHKSFEFTPTDSNLIPRSFGWFCGVNGTIVTKINNSTAEQTMAVDTAYTANAEMQSRVDDVMPTEAWPKENFQYQSVASRAVYGAWGGDVYQGLPTAAGDWYIRAYSWATETLIDPKRYRDVTVTEVLLHITGTPITITPKLTGGNPSEITYRGPLGDGTNGSPDDLDYSVTAPSGTPAITAVNWKFRDTLCGINRPQWGWQWGIPTTVDITPTDCGGNGESVGTWEIAVGSFTMMVDGKDVAYRYLPTFATKQLKINKRLITIDKVKATKVWDGTPNIALGDLTVSGALDFETPVLEYSDIRNGVFADSNVGENKPIYVAGSDGQRNFAQSIRLDWGYRFNYQIANSELLVLGSITKATAKLDLNTSANSIVLGTSPTANLTAIVTDINTNNPPIADAHVADVVVRTTTPGICSVSGALVVTALREGDCVIEATQAASTNYNASIAASDVDSKIETLTISVLAAPKRISIITQDLVVGAGESIVPNYEAIGLLEGDAIGSVSYDYYDGLIKLDAAPSEPGRYRMVPTAVEIVASNLGAYSDNTEFVAGTLLVTTPPPTASNITPSGGAALGGERVVISGTGFSQVTSIMFGDVELLPTQFTVNAEGTEIALTAPAGRGSVGVRLVYAQGELPLDYAYDAPIAVITTVTPLTGLNAGGNIVVVTGENLEEISSVKFGTTVVAADKLTLNAENTALSIVVPAGSGTVSLTLTANGVDSSRDYVYVAPPVMSVTAVDPLNGPEAGGNTVVVSGENLDLVTSVKFGDVEVAAGQRTLSTGNTLLSIVVPVGSGSVKLTIAAGETTITRDYVYEPSKVAPVPQVQFSMPSPQFGQPIAGQLLFFSAEGLKPGAKNTISLYSKKVVLAKGVNSESGTASLSLQIPTSACIKPGLHRLIMQSTANDGKAVRAVMYVVLGPNCRLDAIIDQVSAKSWLVRGISFDYQKWDLSAKNTTTLTAISKWMKTAKKVKVSGYTETDGKGAQLKKINKLLSKKRSQTTVNALKQLGIKAKFWVNPHGSVNPVSKNQAKNRRVEILVTF